MFLRPTIEEVVKRYKIKFHCVQAPFATVSPPQQRPRPHGRQPRPPGLVRCNETQVAIREDQREPQKGGSERGLASERGGCFRERRVNPSLRLVPRACARNPGLVVESCN